MPRQVDHYLARLKRRDEDHRKWYVIVRQFRTLEKEYCEASIYAENYPIHGGGAREYYIDDKNKIMIVEGLEQERLRTGYSDRIPPSTLFAFAPHLKHAQTVSSFRPPWQVE